MYSAVVLDESSHKKLVEWIKKKFPTVINNKWEIVAHHMTITMGPLPSYLHDDMDTTHSLEVNGYAMDDKVLAVRVAGYFTTNKIPHITLAVNRSAGGKPVMSNNLKTWYPLQGSFTIKGVVTEVK